MDKRTKRRRLSTLYYGDGADANFSTARLYRAAKKARLPVTWADVHDFLATQQPYRTHRKARVRFPRNRVVVYWLNQLWMADLASFERFSTENSGTRFLLVVVQALSKKWHIRPIKDKFGKTVAAAFESIFRAAGHAPATLQVDEGKEFLNQYVSAVMHKHNVRMFNVYSDTKASMAERAIRTLRSMLGRAMESYSTRRYLRFLPRVVDTYNKTRNRYGFAPNSVTFKNQRGVWRKLYADSDLDAKQKPTLAVGDHVQLSVPTDKFDARKGRNWGREMFTIVRVKTNHPIPTYAIKDRFDQTIEGMYYAYELQKVPV
jgi:hypothetical protein